MRRLACVAPLAFAVLAACSTSVDDVVIEGDESNLDYRSTAGKEFDVATPATVKLAEADLALTGEARDKRASDLARAKVDSITRALDAELWRIWPEDRRTGEKNVVAMVRMATPAGDALKATADGYTFTYKAQVAGPNDLLDLLPLERDGAKRSLKLKVDGEELILAWSVATETADAYPRYAEMFQDGLDIAIHVGGDHYDPRNDLNESQALFDDLRGMGLKPPVAKFQDLKLDSGPFTGTVVVAGKSVPVRASLVHADLGTAEQLLASFRKAASTADVVIYRGHAGTSLDYSGVVVQYKPSRVAIPASEFKNLDLPEKYQLFVFDGCETYTGYADKLYEHPKKDEKNADVITSVNYGSGLVRAESVRALLHGMLDKDKTSKKWVPRSWDNVLKKVNDAQTGRWTSIYGVHGLADNPRISMLAKPEKIGASCRTNADCGADDSLCVSNAQNQKVCGAACTDDAGCPQGTACRPVLSKSSGPNKQCLAR